MKISPAQAAAIVGLALLLTLPAMVSPPMTHDSFWIDWSWADQFTTELASGNLYPRWLPQSHGGLGSPVFYYYPPLAFYVTGLFGLLGLATYGSIIAAFAFGLAASGFAMLAWLSRRSHSPLLGALLFMALPYHMLDFYGRGALAELIAVAFIPLVALGIGRAVDGKPILLALAYGGLILTHLPLALLVSLFFVIPYALCRTRGRPGALARIALPLALGIGLSAIYLLPALALERYRDTAQLWQLATFRTENWSLLLWSAPGPSPAMRTAVAGVLLVLAYVSAIVLFTSQRRWGVYSLLLCILAAGLLPGFWTLPLLEKVQFPFRLLPLAEFAIATAMARLSIARSLAAAIGLPALVPSAVFLVVQPAHPEVTMEQLAASHPDVPENLPPGQRPYSWPSRWALQLARTHPAPETSGGVTVAPVFYFPAWEVRCGSRAVATSAAPGTNLLRYNGRECTRRLRTTTQEWIGGLISLCALGILFALGFRRSSRRARA